MPANPSRTGLKVFVVLMLLAGAGAAVWFSSRPVAKVYTVKAGSVDKIVPGTVTVAPEKTSELRSEAEGRLLTSSLAVGRAVKTGDSLAQIDHADLANEIAHAEKELAAQIKTNEVNDLITAATMKSADEDFAESQKLHDKQAIADVPFERLKRALDGKKNENELAKVSNGQKVEGLEYKLNTLKLQLARTEIKAPFDGEIAQVAVHEGDLIENKKSLATIISNTRVVTARITEENFAAVAVGQKALVKFLGYGEERFAATVTKKLPTAEESTQRYLAYLDVAIPPARLLPNLSGEVGITVDRREAKALVPRRAVVDGAVLVVEDGRVRRRPVKLDFTSLFEAEVTDGLKPGDLVIVEEIDKFSDGDRVRTEPAK